MDSKDLTTITTNVQSPLRDDMHVLASMEGRTILGFLQRLAVTTAEQRRKEIEAWRKQNKVKASGRAA
jgi:hypothetical protein